MGQCCDFSSTSAGDRSRGKPGDRRHSDDDHDHDNHKPRLDDYDSPGVLTVPGATKADDAESVCDSLPPSPPRMNQGGNPNEHLTSGGVRTSAVLTVGMEDTLEGRQHSDAAGAMGAEFHSSSVEPDPLLFGPGPGREASPGAASSPSTGAASPSAPASPASPTIVARFLAHVNGDRSHAVARSLFENYCIFMAHMQEREDAALLGDLVGASGNSPARGGGGARSTAAAVAATSSPNGGSDGFGQQHVQNVGTGLNFGDGADVSTNASETRVEKWATLPDEPVAHETVERVAKDFMAYLREDLKQRGWAAEFFYEQQGFASKGNVTATIKITSRSETGLAHTFQLVACYHAVQLF